MNRKSLAILAMVVGVVMLAYGLFSRLLALPVVGPIRYVDLHLGGKEQAEIIIALFSASALLAGFSEGVKRFAMLFGGVGFGLLIGSLVAVYRSTVDQIEQMGDPDVNALLKQAQPQVGLWIFAAGVLLWLCGLVYTLFEHRERYERRW
jgi:hypothetical protein